MKVINQPCEVVCSFNSQGKIRPDRVRITDAEGEYQVLVVTRLIKSDELKQFGIRFRLFLCEGIVNERKIMFELKFEMDNLKWVIHRM